VNEKINLNNGRGEINPKKTEWDKKPNSCAVVTTLELEACETQTALLVLKSSRRWAYDRVTDC
jgi:hypothetical protein